MVEPPVHAASFRLGRAENIGSLQANLEREPSPRPSGAPGLEALRLAKLGGSGAREHRRFWASTRDEIYERDGGRYWVCGGLAAKVTKNGRPGFHVDHVTPIALGGAHADDNRAVAHPSCNQWRGKSPPTVVDPATTGEIVRRDQPDQTTTPGQHRKRLAGRPGAAALAYAARGWAVFPLHSVSSGRCTCRRDCAHPGKHPLTRHGLHDATTDQDTIRAWWGRRRWANIGVATGTRSGLIVIDVDPASGGDESLDRLQSLMGSLPTTLTARTGGGGLHFYYRHAGVELRNTAGRLPGVAEELPGLDLRGDRGYVVVPPSRHISGGAYGWVDDSATVIPAPGWLRPPARAEFPSGLWARPLPRRGGSRYGLAALRPEVDGVRQAPVGTRNNRLNRAAFCLGMLVAGGELDSALIEDELLSAALDAGLPEAEARASLASGLRAGGREPRRRATR